VNAPPRGVTKKAPFLPSAFNASQSVTFLHQ
jgi:hypothetical protein